MRPQIIGIVEPPAVRVLDQNGRDRHMVRTKEALSKHYLSASLLAGGYGILPIDMRQPEHVETEYEQMQWAGMTMTSLAKGMRFLDLDPRAADVWALTCNYQVQQTLVCRLIEYLSRYRPVVVGGVDAGLQSEPYLRAGASLIVRTRDGAINQAAIDYVLGKEPRIPLSGVVLEDGTSIDQEMFLHPEQWPLPPLWIMRQMMGYEYWEGNFSTVFNLFYPQAALLYDIGCDRGCDFCATPLMWKFAAKLPGGRRELGNIYKYMSPDRALQWIELAKAAGAKSVISLSDQFLGRVLLRSGEGRREAIQICRYLRKYGMFFGWPNGSNELSKMADDEELIDALYGPGCFHAYIPAERPIEGPKMYPKLLELEAHKKLVRRIMAAGVKTITYGMVLGLRGDNSFTLKRTYKHVLGFKKELKESYPGRTIWVAPLFIRPIPGTGQYNTLEKHGLLHHHPTIRGAYGTPGRTEKLSELECAESQQEFLELSDEPKWHWGL